MATRPGAGWRKWLLGFGLWVFGTAVAHHPVRAETPSSFSRMSSSVRAEALYADGQRAYEARHYDRAGRLWSEALKLQPESPGTSTIRANTVNWILLVYVHAYREDADAKHLRAAADVVGGYERELVALYGSRWQLWPHVADRRDEVHQLLAEHAKPRGTGEPEVSRSGRGAEHVLAQGGGAREVGQDDRPSWHTGSDRMFRVGVGLTLGGVVALLPAVWGAAASVYKAGRLRKQILATSEQTGSADIDGAALYQQGWIGGHEATVALVAGVASLVLVSSGVVVLVLEKRRRRGGETFVPTALVTPTFMGGGFRMRF
ncbi:MAG: hypothetical protein V3V08_10310 [Nannocystaceae bacterium]